MMEGDVTFVVTVENATAAGLLAARNDINRAASQIQSDVTSKYGSINNMVKATEESFRRLGNTLVGAGGALMGTFTLPVVMGFRQIISEGSDLEVEIYRIMSIFRESGVSIDETKKKIEEFAFAAANSSQFTASEILKAMYAMGQAGYNLEQVFSILPSIMNLATAQQYELLDSFQLVNSASKSYGMTTDKTIRFTEMAADAATRYNLTLEQLQEGMKYFAPVTATLNMSMSEMLVAFGLLTERGFSGMQAGRILRDSIADLVAPTLESKEILERHSLSLYTNQEAINSVAYAYHAAQKRLEAMKDAHLGTKEELLHLNSQITTNKRLLEEATRVNDTGSIKNYKDAISDLSATQQDLTLARQYDNISIEKQAKKVKELETIYKQTGALGLLPMSKLIENLAKSNLTQAEYFEVFGKQSAGAMMSLVDEYRKAPSAFIETAQAIERSNEATVQAEIQMKSTAYQLKQLKNIITAIMYEGYKALAPVIAEINKFFIENKDTLMKLGNEIITSFVPALQNIFGMLKNVLEVFMGLNPQTRNFFLKIGASATIFLAAIGPLLLYTGALAWATASIMKLGRGTFETIGLISAFIKTLSTTKTIFLANDAIFGTAKMMEMVGATGTMINPSLVTCGNSMGAIEASALGASGALAGVGSSLLTFLPYLAIAAAAGYLLYYGWQNNVGGMRDATDKMAKDVAKSFMKMRDDVFEITDSMGTLGEGFGTAISAGIEASSPKAEYALGEIIGSFARAVYESLDFVYKLGTNIRDAFYNGIIGFSFDISKSLVESITSKDYGGKQSEMYKGLIKGFYGGMKEVDEASGKLIDTTKAKQRELDNINLQTQGRLVSPYNPEYISDLTKEINAQKELLNQQESIVTDAEKLATKMKASDYISSFLNKNKETTNTLPQKSETEKKVKSLLELSLDEDYINSQTGKVAKTVKDAWEEELPNGLASLMVNDESEEQFKELGSLLGAAFGENLDEEAKKAIDDFAKYMDDKVNGVPGSIYFTSNAAEVLGSVKEISAKDVNPYTSSKIGDYYYSNTEVQNLVSSWRGDYDSMPALTKMVESLTPLGKAKMAGGAEQKVEVSSPSVDVKMAGETGMNEPLNEISSNTSLANTYLQSLNSNIIASLQMINSGKGGEKLPMPTMAPVSIENTTVKEAMSPTMFNETSQVPAAPYVSLPPTTNIKNLSTTFNIYPKQSLTDGEINEMVDKLSNAVNRRLGDEL